MTTAHRILRAGALAAAAAALAACSFLPNDEANPRTLAAAHLASAAGGAAQPNPQSPVQGDVRFSQVRDVVSVSGRITGLKPNAQHAFHIHAKGDCSSPDFESAGGHFNPTGKPHGPADSAQSHVGDMPPLMADANGNAEVSFNTTHMSLRGVDSVVGKAIIVHRDPDDVNAQPSGNAGPRLACGVIKQQPAS